jgi:hypothetical protein
MSHTTSSSKKYFTMAGTVWRTRRCRICLPYQAAVALPPRDEWCMPFQKIHRSAILVVDDEPAILQLITTSLEEEGFAVTSVLDAAAGPPLVSASLSAALSLRSFPTAACRR